MSDKTIKYLAIALGVLIIIYGLFRFVESRTLVNPEPEGFNLKQLKEKTVDKISIKNSKDKYEIEKSNGNWQVNGKDVDKDTLTQLWDGLKNADIGTLATDKKGKFATFEINEAKGRIVTFYNSGQIKNSFVFGKQTADFSGSYIRKVDGNEVYTVSGSLSSIFDKIEKDWIAKPKGKK